MNRFKAQLDSRTRRSASGYSLAELLVAIAILGVGMAMAAQLFPAGLLANEYSGKDLIGTIISRNGIAIAKARLTHPLTRDDGNPWPDNTSELGLAICSNQSDDPDDDDEETNDGNMRRFPIDFQNANRGFLALARPAVNKNTNDYLIVIISYRKSPAGGDVGLESLVGGESDESKATIKFEGLTGEEVERIQVGSPVILDADGTHARIVEKTVSDDGDDVTVLLDRPLDNGTQDVHVVYEENAVTSPAMAVVAARTSLKQ